MTPEQFCYWLQGYFEISGFEDINLKASRVIRDHLKQVFDKQTPDRGVLTFESGPIKSDFVTGRPLFDVHGVINDPLKPDRQHDLVTGVVLGEKKVDNSIYREAPTKPVKINYKHKKQVC